MEKMTDSMSLGNKQESATDDAILIRLENILSTNSQPVNMSSLFTGKQIKKVMETTLDGNLPLDQLKRLKWRKTGSGNNYKMDSQKKGEDLDYDSLTILGKHIRTFQ